MTTRTQTPSSKRAPAKRPARPLREYRPIPPEPWGDKLARMRRMNDMYLRDAAKILVDYGFTKDPGPNYVKRIEEYAETPTAYRHMQPSIVLCLAYGVDPAEMGLDVQDLPAALYDRAMEEFGYGKVTDRKPHEAGGRVSRYPPRAA